MPSTTEKFLGSGRGKENRCEKMVEKGEVSMKGDGDEITPEREAYIMSVLLELYEEQVGAKYTWKKVDKEEQTA